MLSSGSYWVDGLGHFKLNLISVRGIAHYRDKVIYSNFKAKI